MPWLVAVEQANGGSVILLGFSWDYPDAATDWPGGKLAKAASCCCAHGTPGAHGAALGRAFGDADIRTVKPVVGEILPASTE